MADDIVLSAAVGVGDTVAADEIASKKYQRVKLIHGADGVNDGDVSTANGLPVKGTGTAGTANAGVITVQGIASMTPVQIADNGGSVTVDNGGTFAVQVDGTALTRLTDIETNTDSNAVVGNGAAATAQRVTLANDSTGTIATIGAVTAITNALPAGTNNIGDVDIASVPAPLSTTGGGTEAAALRVTVASDSTGVLSVDDNGGSLTVDGTVAVSGTVAVTQSGTWDEVGINDSGNSITVDAPVGTPVFVRLSDGAAAITALPVSLASVPSHAVTNAGTFAVQSASAGDVAHDAADSGNPHKIGAKATTSQSGLTLVANADRTDAYAGIDGVLLTRPHTNLESIVTGNASNTDGTSTQCIAAQAAGIKTYLTSIILTNMSATGIYVEVKDGATAKLTIPLPASGGAIFNPPVPIPGSAATAWNFDPSAAATTVYCSMVGFTSKV